MTDIETNNDEQLECWGVCRVTRDGGTEPMMLYSSWQRACDAMYVAINVLGQEFHPYCIVDMSKDVNAQMAIRGVVDDDAKHIWEDVQDIAFEEVAPEIYKNEATKYLEHKS